MLERFCRAPRRTHTPSISRTSGQLDAAVGPGACCGPDWRTRLLAHPAAEIVVDGERRWVLARLATEDERARLWPGFDAVYAGFPSYRQRAGDRQIRLFILEPSTSTGRGPFGS